MPAIAPAHNKNPVNALLSFKKISFRLANIKFNPIHNFMKIFYLLIKA